MTKWSILLLTHFSGYSGCSSAPWAVREWRGLEYPPCTSTVSIKLKYDGNKHARLLISKNLFLIQLYLCLYLSLFAAYGRSASWFFFMAEETAVILSALLVVLSRYPVQEVKFLTHAAELFSSASFFIWGIWMGLTKSLVKKHDQTSFILIVLLSGMVLRQASPWQQGVHHSPLCFLWRSRFFWLPWPCSGLGCQRAAVPEVVFSPPFLLCNRLVVVFFHIYVKQSISVTLTSLFYVFQTFWASPTWKPEVRFYHRSATWGQTPFRSLVCSCQLPHLLPLCRDPSSWCHHQWLKADTGGICQAARWDEKLRLATLIDRTPLGAAGMKAPLTAALHTCSCWLINVINAKVLVFNRHVEFLYVHVRRIGYANWAYASVLLQKNISATITRQMVLLFSFFLLHIIQNFWDVLHASFTYVQTCLWLRCA